MTKRSKTLKTNFRLSQKDIKALYTPLEVEGRRYTRQLQVYLRPSIFGECQAQKLGTTENPCPFVSCKWNLKFDVKSNGNIIDNNIDEFSQHTCALQAIDNYKSTEKERNDNFLFTEREIADLLGLTMQRAQQIIDAAIEKIKKELDKLRENTGKNENNRD